MMIPVGARAMDGPAVADVICDDLRGACTPIATTVYDGAKTNPARANALADYARDQATFRRQISELPKRREEYLVAGVERGDGRRWGNPPDGCARDYLTSDELALLLNRGAWRSDQRGGLIQDWSRCFLAISGNAPWNLRKVLFVWA